MTTPLITRRTVLGGAVAAATLVSTRAHAAARRPNILLIFPDQLRGMALSFYGEKNIRTPVFDRLLKRSVSFSHAYAADPVCAPSRGSLLTGLYPTGHGVTENGDRLSSKVPSLPSRLAAAGYLTGYIGKWHLDGNEKPGFVPPARRHGFQWWRGYNSGHHWKRSKFFVDNDPTPRSPKPADRFEPAYQVDHALEFMEGTKEKAAPWFLMMSFGPPHPPGSTPIEDWGADLPRQFLDKVDPSAITFNPNVPEWIRGPNKGRRGTGASDPGARHHLHGYYASILALQQEVNRLLRGLDGLGLTEDTLVVLAADHGEMGGAHGMYKKGEPYEEALRVPLGFSWPGTLQPRRHDMPVSLVDVTPTLLALAEAKGMRRHGIDLSAALRGGTLPERPSVLATGKTGKKEQWFALRGPRYTYAVAGQGDQRRKILYDNAEDPFQETNLADKPKLAGVQERMARRLKSERARTKSGPGTASGGTKGGKKGKNGKKKKNRKKGKRS